jgi:ADP-dependent NAD(P)H-hydrate dehydratase / NAD(P)H-hydrate epimerase
MKLFSAQQIKAWDAYTIQHEPIASIDLMERAAQECVLWMGSHLPKDKQVYIFCGPGNNGGDGLAIARLLREKGVTVHVYIAETGAARSTDCAANLRELRAMGEPVVFIQTNDDLPAITNDAIIIDALYGYGLNRPLSGLPENIVNHINASNATVIAIDMPSGLYTDKSSAGNTIVKATFTLSFQIMKLAFLLPENAANTGEVHLLNIGLHQKYYDETIARFEIISHEYIHSLHQPRKKFSHKGSYGHAGLIAGSYGMMGAAVLGARACMRSGAGKLTCYIPGCGYNIVQTAIPEAMCVTDDNQTHHTQLHLKTKYDAYAIGPGIGAFEETAAVMKELFDEKPGRLIVDADGLNMLSAHPSLLSTMPPNTILTPHPKEFEKLFGSTANQFDRLELALTKAKELQVYILIKGNFSFMATPGGKGYFNPTGNPGMATAGSGDVLTGMLLGLYAQFAETENVLLTGVYMHGLAGDIAAAHKTEEAMIASDIIDYLPQAFTAIKKPVYFP